MSRRRRPAPRVIVLLAWLGLMISACQFDQGGLAFSDPDGGGAIDPPDATPQPPDSDSPDAAPQPPDGDDPTPTAPDAAPTSMPDAEPVDPCSQGGCQCDPWLDRCGDSCVDLDSDDDHCGSCGESCSGDQVCSEGECRQFDDKVRCDECPCDDCGRNERCLEHAQRGVICVLEDGD